MAVVLTRRQARELLAEHGVRPSRALGQNFVVDPNTVRRIARIAGVGPGDHVIEVGGGLGSLTLALSETGASVTTVEVDHRLAEILRGVVGPAGVEVLEADAMSLDWDELLAGEVGPWALVANLPYNVATPLVANLLDFVPRIERMLVMVQKEVAERLAARPGDESYGAVSVKVAYWADAELAGQIGPAVFMPRPRVDSALVRVTRLRRPRIDPEVVDPTWLFQLVRAGFGLRRKMLRRSLAGLVPEGAFGEAGLSGTERAEELGVEQWGSLARAAGATRRPGT